MSLIEEMYQDADGNWLPEAEAILAKATAITTSNGTHIPRSKVFVAPVLTWPLKKGAAGLEFLWRME